jgi:hypothetical protein
VDPPQPEAVRTPCPCCGRAIPIPCLLCPHCAAPLLDPFGPGTPQDLLHLAGCVGLILAAALAAAALALAAGAALDAEGRAAALFVAVAAPALAVAAELLYRHRGVRSRWACWSSARCGPAVGAADTWEAYATRREGDRARRRAAHRGSLVLAAVALAWGL